MKQTEVQKKVRREALVAMQRDGRKNRAVTFPDRKKVASKKACRGKVAW
jgi:hypothetical protein